MARTQVQSELIATNAISGTIIADNAITATHIATNSISGTLVQDSGIVTTMIAANNVTAAKIVTDAIQTRHIADDQVTQAKIAVNSVGISELAVTDGSNGQALTTNGSGTLAFSTISSTPTSIADADSDTKIQAEESSDEDKIRFDTGGTQRLLIDGNNLFLTGGTDARIQLNTGGSGTGTGNDTVHIRGDGDNMKLMTAADGHYIFENNGTERMRIDASGNIGFNTTGTTAGDSTDSQVQTATPNRFVFNNDYSNGYTDASLKLYLFNSGSTRQGFTSGPAYDLQYHSSGSDSGRHAFYVANSEIMRINKTQVGIGDNSVISSNTTSQLAVRKDNAGGRGGEISIVNYAANTAGNEAALNFGLENSTYHSNDGNAQIKAVVIDGSNAATDIVFSNWMGSSFKQRMRLKSNGTFYISEDLGAHTGTYSYDHNTYQHAAVFGANSTPNGSVVIEDYDVSSGIGNTVLRLYLRDEDPATNAVFIDFADGGGRVGSVTHNDDGGGVSYNTTSDYRLKENVNYDWDGTTLLKQLKPAKFNFKRNPAKTIQGMLAHEVMDIVPSSVRGDKDHMEPIGTIKDSDGEIVYEGVYEHFTKTDEGQTWEQTGTEPLYQELDYSRLVPLLVKTVQEQQTIIEDLKSRIATLEG